MDFFELPTPPPQPPPEPEPKPWWQAPRNELGAPVPLRLVIARTDTIVVAVLDAVAFTTGIELHLDVRRAVPANLRDPLGRMRTLEAGTLPPELLRFGVQFADGRKATTLGHTLPLAVEEPGQPERPVLSPGGGSGSNGSWETSLWLWPLPPPGPLAFVVEWPAEGIELTRREVDAAPFLAASELSEILWPPAPSPDDGGWQGFGTMAFDRDE